MHTDEDYKQTKIKTAMLEGDTLGKSFVFIFVHVTKMSEQDKKLF